MKMVSASTLTLAARLCLGAAACLSLYLAAAALAKVPLPGCEAGSDCAKALQSPWAFVFGLPVSFPAFLLYSLTLMKSGAYVRRERSLPELEGMAAVTAVATATVWFSCLQIAAVSVFCAGCALVHAFAAVGAACLWWARKNQPAQAIASGGSGGRGFQRHQAFRRAAAGCSAAACVLLLAAGAPPPAAQVPAANSSETTEYISAPLYSGDKTGVALFDGRYHVNPEEFPVIGSDAPDAPTAILLCDYASKPSRRYLAAVQTLLPAAAKEARIIVVPAALTPQSEDVQRTMLALFLKDRAAWQTLSALITSGQIPAETAEVERVARKLAGPGHWMEAREANAFKIAHHVELAAALLKESGRGEESATAPVVIQASRVLLPASADMDELTDFLKGGTPGAAPGPASVREAAETVKTAAPVGVVKIARISAAAADGTGGSISPPDTISKNSPENLLFPPLSGPTP